MFNDVVQELEFRIDMIRDDLAKAQERLRAAQEDLMAAEANMASSYKNLRYLKKEAQVVLITEYLSSRSIYFHAKNDRRTARTRIKQAATDIDSVTRELKLAELSLEAERSKANITAKILEFPHA